MRCTVGAPGSLSSSVGIDICAEHGVPPYNGQARSEYQLGISEAILLRISHGDIVARPDTADVHIFGTTVFEVSTLWVLNCVGLWARHSLIFLHDHRVCTFGGRVAEDDTAFLCAH